MELTRGQIVTSRRGRDVTKAYVVLAVEKDRALLCDGLRKPLAAPKAKNPLHIQPTNSTLPEEALQNDLAIKMALKEFNKSRKAQAEGG